MKLPWSREETTGQQAERFARGHLASQGLTIVATNYATRRGEIDLVARDGELLVFVEVRLRNHKGFASGAESVDLRKQQRLVRAADHYIQQHFGSEPPPCRFDVVSLHTNRDNRKQFQIDWLKDAFRPML